MKLLLFSLITQFPLGIYWAGESTFQNDPDRWAKIETQLKLLSEDGFNAIWLTHLPAVEAAQFARLAKTYNIQLMVRTSEIDLNVPWVLNGDHAALIAKNMDDWGDAPRPASWVFGDEVPNESFENVEQFLVEWDRQTTDSLTTVQHWGGMGYSSLCKNEFCLNVYPFLDASNYPTTIPNAFCSLSRYNARLNTSWMMFQAFEQPGLFTLPTPAQVTWQAWAAFMNGARGLFAFIYLPTGTVTGLLDDELLPSSQYLALSTEYKRMAPYTHLVCDPTIYCALTNGSESSAVSGMRSGNRRYLVVLGGYEEDQNLTVQFGPEITGVTQDGRKLTITRRNGLGEVAVQVSAGTAVVLACTVNSSKMPRVMDFRQVLANASVGVEYAPNGLNGTVLTATLGLAWPANYCLYDLGSVPRKGLRVVKYNGWSQNRDTTGVQLLQSNDNRRYSVFSQNSFNRGIPMTGRYLRASISWGGNGELQLWMAVRSHGFHLAHQVAAE